MPKKALGITLYQFHEGIHHGLEELKCIFVGDLAVFAEQFIGTSDIGFGLPDQWHVKEG